MILGGLTGVMFGILCRFMQRANVCLPYARGAPPSITRGSLQDPSHIHSHDPMPLLLLSPLLP